MTAEARLLAIVRSLAAELKAGGRDFSAFGIDHHLERDFGLDSLARVELFARVERVIGHALGEAAFAAETPADLLRLIEAGGQVAPAVPAVAPADGAPVPGFVPPAAELPTLIDVIEWHVQYQPERIHLHLLDEQAVAEPVSYGRLAAAARNPRDSHRPGDRPARRTGLCVRCHQDRVLPPRHRAYRRVPAEGRHPLQLLQSVTDRVRWHARWVVPVASPAVADGTVVTEGDRIIWVGPRGSAPAGGRDTDCGAAILTPGLVNAHTHLDLTMMRGVLEDLPFFEWVLAYLANVSMRRVRMATARSSERSAMTMLRRAGIPEDTHALFLAICMVSSATGAAGKKADQDAFGRALVEVTMTRTAGFDADQRQRVIQLLSQFAQGRTRTLVNRLNDGYARVA